VTRAGGREPSPCLLRVLADAERAAWIGDAARARKLLRLGDRLAGPDQRPHVLLAAESVRAARRGAVGTSSPPRRELPAARLPRLTPPRSVTLAPARAAPQVTPTPPPRPRDRVRKRGASLRAISACLVVLVLGCWLVAPPALAELASFMGRPGTAVRLLAHARDARALLVRGDARLAMGDSSGAISDYKGAGRLAEPPGESAWEAGVRLARIAGQENAAADALLQAYVLGIGHERWARVAAVLASAGRHEEAGRVRSGVGR
jgi:hypothetical protein